MAKIKTQLTNNIRRVITKVVDGERRVSCSCCEGAECCMYPALGVSDGLITIEDLPDTVIYRGLISGDKTFTKVDPPEEYGTYTAYYLTGSEPVGADGDFIGIDSGSGLDQWTNYVRGGINGIGFCLIESFDNVTGVNDEFADTYTVTTNQSSGVVNRQSLCVWTGVDGLGCGLELRYEDRIAPPRGGTRFKWTVDYAEGGLEPCNERAIAVKGPHQNTPVGDYDGGIVTVT